MGLVLLVKAVRDAGFVVRQIERRRQPDSAPGRER